VDALVLASKVDVSPAVLDELRERQSIADLAGGAELRVGGHMFAIKRNRRMGFCAFENADLRGTFDERATGGWRLEVVLRATFLATHSLATALDLGKAVCAAFGDIQGMRLRRFDLAADYVNFPLSREDVDRVVTRRARTQSFVVDRKKDLDDAPGDPYEPTRNAVEHRSPTMVVTGITVAQANPLMARIYDKTAELRLAGREEKRTIEHALWTRGGWNGSSDVTRVEFQHRGAFLDEVELRDPFKLEGKLDAVWQHDVKWLRLVDPSTASRRTRCTLDPRWSAVVGTEFRHCAAPVERVRNRGGAKPEHVFGAAMSRLASTGRLTRIDFGVNEQGEPLTETAFVERMEERALVPWLTERVDGVFQRAASDTLAAMLNRWGPREAVRRFLAKYNGVAARFSSADDTAASKRAGRRAS
jgi:hypothetical protein